MIKKPVLWANNHEGMVVLRTQLAYWEGWLSIVFNTLLFVLKYWAGVTSGSIAVIADAFHSLSDSVTSVIVIVSAKISAKSADEQHPFGHGRVELIASIMIGILLAVVGMNFLIEAIIKLKNHQVAIYGWHVVAVFVFSIIVKESLAQFSIRAGMRTDSKSLKADGWHHRSDAVASFVIVVGIFAGRYFWWVDGVLGVFVALLILFATYGILKESINPLIGETPDDQLIMLLKEISDRNIVDDVDLHHVHVHRYGASTEVTFHIRFLNEISFKKAHHHVTCIERQLKEQFNLIATIHFEPPD